MENMLTVTDVSRSLGLSTRMLRYYEEQGLIESGRAEGYAYRMYDQEAVRRLRQVIVLRRLRIPLREVKLILDDPSAQWAIYVFQYGRTVPAEAFGAGHGAGEPRGTEGSDWGAFGLA